MQKRKKDKFFLKVVLAIILFILLLMIINRFFSPYGKEIKTSFIASNISGFDLNKNELTFGKIKTGNSASRGLVIKNNFDKKKRITFICLGKIKDYLIVSENDFILMPDEARTVDFSVFLPTDLDYGTYYGKIQIRTSEV